MEKKGGFLFKDEDSNDASSINNQNDNIRNNNFKNKSNVNSETNSTFDEKNSHESLYDDNLFNNSNKKHENINNSRDENSFGIDFTNIQDTTNKSQSSNTATNLSSSTFNEKLNSISSNNDFHNQNPMQNNNLNQHDPISYNNNNYQSPTSNNNFNLQDPTPNYNFDNQNTTMGDYGGYIPPKKKSKAPVFIIIGIIFTIFLLVLFLVIALVATNNSMYESIYYNDDDSSIDNDYNVDDYSGEGSDDVSEFNIDNYILLSNLKVTSTDYENEYILNENEEFVNVEFDLKNVGIEGGIEVGELIYSMNLCFDITNGLEDCDSLKDYLADDDISVSDKKLDVGGEVHLNFTSVVTKGSSNFYIEIETYDDNYNELKYKTEKVEKS